MYVENMINSRKESGSVSQVLKNVFTRNTSEDSGSVLCSVT